jgi:hypothetical protein
MATMLELGGFKSYYSLWLKSQLGEQREAYGRQMQTAFGMRGCRRRTEMLPRFETRFQSFVRINSSRSISFC